MYKQVSFWRSTYQNCIVINNNFDFSNNHLICYRRKHGASLDAYFNLVQMFYTSLYKKQFYFLTNSSCCS